MAVGFQVFRSEFNVGIGDWVDIYGSATFSFDGGDNVNGDFVQGKSWITGGFFFVEILGNQSECFFAADTATPIPPVTPPEKDPPFPPVWPYPTGPLYQREHWGMNQNMIRGDTYTFDFVVARNGAAFNLTGCTVRFTAKYYYTDADSAAPIRLDSAGLGGVVITSAADGAGTVEVPAATTASLAAHRTRLVYDLQVVTGDGKVYTVRRGYLFVLPDVTITA